MEITKRTLFSFLWITVLGLSSCSVSVSHPEKGESVFNSHKPNEAMSPALQKDLDACNKFAYEMLLKSGLRIYRAPQAAIKQCLRNKGWEFHP